MNRLEFVCDKWLVDESAPLKSATRMLLPDFRGEEIDCWHLRGRGWKWITLKCIYPILMANEEYELCLWAKFDYYSGNGTRCYTKRENVLMQL